MHYGYLVWGIGLLLCALWIVALLVARGLGSDANAVDATSVLMGLVFLVAGAFFCLRALPDRVPIGVLLPGRIVFFGAFALLFVALAFGSGRSNGDRGALLVYAGIFAVVTGVLVRRAWRREDD